MTIEDLYQYCLAKKGVTEHFPFDSDTLVFKIGGKMFLLSSLKEWENGNPKINLKCEIEKSAQLRADFNGITPGYHMNKMHWNTVLVNDDVPSKVIIALIDHSYDLIFKSLSQKLQKEIQELLD